MDSLSEHQTRFWMDKAVQWGQATSPSAQQDISQHMQSLGTFLQQLVHTLQTMSSTTEAMKSFPFVGQFLGRLCWNPYVTAEGASRRLLLQCMWLLYSAEPQNVVEHRANVWIRSLLCHLTSEDEGSMVYALEKHAGFPPQQYYSESLKKMVALLATEVNRSHITSSACLERCRFDSIHSLSVTCVPLVTCPEVAPLIGALLKHYSLCRCSNLSEEFIKAVNKAWLSKKLMMEVEAVMALWSTSLPSLEQAILILLERVLSDPKVMQNLETVVADSLLPKASALHCHIFLIVNDVFRNALITIEENLTLRGLVQVFTSCFLQIRAAQRPQERLPLRSFFPHVPHNLLTPLLMAQSDVPQHVWLEHLSWIGTLLEKFLSERNQEEDSGRGDKAVFEAWFLLVQCGHWIDVAAKLLVTVGSEQSKPLLFLLMFYHHPTNRGQQSTRHNMVARQAWSDLRSLFLAHTLSPDRLSAVNESLCTPSTNFVLCLLLNFAIFSQASTSRVTDVIQKVLTDAGVRCRAMGMLCFMHERLKGDSAVDARLTMLEERLHTA
ncbi:Fanconi anemia group C protein [Tachysurus vachellii]|uniref:Fanconi anemia group C protein n=1 Tax=Tachysurus vachellii TaxID=175792 RepID=UPI00296B1D01|nr:Fanconi anemia group C protein [Tachysurus vachellii]